MNSSEHTLSFQCYQVATNAGFRCIEDFTQVFEIYEFLLCEKLLNL